MPTGKQVLICYTPFTGLGKNDGYRGDKWLLDRIRIFKSLTLQSLLNQSERRFIHWISWRSEERTNPQVLELKKSLEGLRGYSFIFTFGGLCFQDDVFPEDEARTRLIRNLGATLPELAPFVKESDWVKVLLVPSDDMFAKDSLKAVYDSKPEEKKAVNWKNGMIYNAATREVAEYNCDTNPPFYTLFFPREIFLDPWKHFWYAGQIKSHEYVDKFFKLELLPGRGFMVNCHGQNISTVWSIPYKGREILGEERERIWLDFGIYGADPLPMHKSWRLQGRRLYNLLPRRLQPLIKSKYHAVRTYVRTRAEKRVF